MKEALNSITGRESTRDSIVRKLKEANEGNPVHRVGFVSGIILSDGPIQAPRNLGYLARYTRYIARHVDYPVFSAINLLSDLDKEQAVNLIRIESSKCRSQQFWGEILKSGFITDIFMTPRWINSTGARNEYKTAVELGFNIHHLKWKQK